MPTNACNLSCRLKQSYRYLLGLFILIAFVALIENFVGWGKLLTPWLSLSVGAAATALALTMISYFARAWRFYDYFRSEMRGAFGLCFKLMLQHNVLNNFLPMRSGEISFPILMARYFSVPAIRSVPALLWFRLLDLHTLGLLALAAAPLWTEHYLLIALAILLWAPLPWLGFLYGDRALQNLAARLPPKAQKLALQIRDGLPNQTSLFWRAWAWTVANWLVKLIGFAWVLLLFADLPLFVAWLGAIGGDLSSVLPIHGIAGVGTFEAGVVAAMAPFGVPLQTGTLAAVNLHLFVLGTSVLGGAAALLIARGARHG